MWFILNRAGIRQESVAGLVFHVLRDQSSPAFPFSSCRGFSFKQILTDYKHSLCFKIALPLGHIRQEKRGQGILKGPACF